MNTDMFFNAYREMMNKANKEFQKNNSINKLDLILLILSALLVVLFVISLYIWNILAAVIFAILALVALLIIAIKHSFGRAYKEDLDKQKQYQQWKYICIKQFLNSYAVNNNDLIDLLIERLKENKEKYNYGNAFFSIVRDVIGAIMVIVSQYLTIDRFLVFMFKDVEEYDEVSILNTVYNNIVPLALLSGLVLIVVIASVYLWSTDIKPLILKKYYYHDEMINDLCEFKLFRMYHELQSLQTQE